ncbi:uncharacterized protein BT62DRAFT_983322 [Guyanagaster necrorhizus]|uniref:Uncharacterized protein n=1 Tax=Guyanagaster necrorhizus TaxID=856835 RepID=A0A9P7VH11_9AGAR|nr:uncharacterized protein BT62DRAFT_983322 [Guyanagaster necrorhizus MCA 3950]KAG7439814.1 hypothetical protein BT62DRAFT_983322 [Guyanagaster necrorhizus MCA 3950]
MPTSSNQKGDLDLKEVTVKSADPLPSSPSHLLNDLFLQATLYALKDFIVVNTPFNVNCLENILYFYPNEYFVSSVIHGLWNGFWPLNLAFCDYEIAARCWSPPLPDGFTLLPGMKVSSMFIVWQNRKPHVIMDYTSSGLNAGIPASKAKIKYNDMHLFGKTLYNTKL